MGREVAVKVLKRQLAERPEQLSRFEREAQALAALNHPNIAAIYGVDESAGVRFLVMEFVPGETLADASALPSCATARQRRTGAVLRE